MPSSDLVVGCVFVSGSKTPILVPIWPKPWILDANSKDTKVIHAQSATPWPLQGSIAHYAIHLSDSATPKPPTLFTLNPKPRPQHGTLSSESNRNPKLSSCKVGQDEQGPACGLQGFRGRRCRLGTVGCTCALRERQRDRETERQRETLDPKQMVPEATTRLSERS